MNMAFVFPGQGAQYVGMGMDLVAAYAIAKETLAEADDALGFSLSKMIAAGPEEELRLTYYTQPAILAVSVAALRALREQIDVQPRFVAGHSLGEYTALVATGVIEYADALRLVHQRGLYMDAAVPGGVGGMAAVLGADTDLLQGLCQVISRELGAIVEVANVNCPGQVVVSGTRTAVDELVRRAAEAKARRAVLLDVSGPFHSSLMAPAGERLAELLADTNFAAASCPVIANVSALPAANPEEMRAALARQVASPVLWEASIRYMSDAGVNTYVELGPGAVLSGLVRKTDRAARTLHVDGASSLQTTLTALREGLHDARP